MPATGAGTESLAISLEMRPHTCRARLMFRRMVPADGGGVVIVEGQQSSQILKPLHPEELRVPVRGEGAPQRARPFGGHEVLVSLGRHPPAGLGGLFKNPRFLNVSS